MKIEIHYTSFNLRADTEAVVSTPRTLLFFEEMDIPYTIDSRPCETPPYKKDWIEYHEQYGTIDVDLETPEDIRVFADRYCARILIQSSSCVIDFLQERMNAEPMLLRIQKKRV